MARIGLSLVLVGVLSGVLWADGFAGGTGEPNDPYQIATAEQLLSLDQGSLRGRYFVLVDDIDMIAAWPYEGIEYFWGALDGQGHTIRNFTYVSGDSSLGLFRTVGYYASGRGGRSEVPSEMGPSRISNLIIEDAYVAGKDDDFEGIGILAGLSRGIVTHCQVSGTVVTEASSEAESNAGGLIGKNYGEVLMCSANCSVDSYGPTGGLVGANLGTIAQCQSHGDVNGVRPVGGLVGSNGWSSSEEMGEGLIESCFSDAVVSGENYVGGLLGRNGGILCFSQADGIVTGLDMLGGLVGVNNDFDSSATISSSCATGIVIYSGEEYLKYGSMGSLVGFNYPRGFVSDCYSYVSTLFDYYGADGLVGNSDGGFQRCFTLSDLSSSDNVTKSSYCFGPSYELTKVSWEQMRNPDTFVGWDFYGRSEDGWLDDWFIPEAGLLQLSWQADEAGLIPVPLLKGASVDVAKCRLDVAGLCLGEVLYDYCADEDLDVNAIITTRPYPYASLGQDVDMIVNLGPFVWEDADSEPLKIQTPGQLDCLATAQDYWNRYYILTADLDMTGWTYRQPLFDGFFEGVLDGQGYTISNLVIDQLFADEAVGLFREIGEDGYVGDLVLKAVSVSGNEIVGSLAGVNNGVIQGVTAEINVTGTQGVGGLVGQNEGTLMDCHVTGRVNPLDEDEMPGQLIGSGSGYGGSFLDCTADVECPRVEEELEFIGSYSSSSSGRR